ncbi:MAG TPA: hypothetical protein VHL77_05505, partial [Ferruginibacter sp.]|nr:hypothetical protein [Ferruginibacter sp.]
QFYFEGNEMIAGFALMCHQKHIEVGCRLDLTLTDEGFKVLEINNGSSIGGWQIHSFEPLIRQLHSPLADPETANDFESKNTQVIYIQFLVDKILQHVASIKDEINIFIDLSAFEEQQFLRNANAFFNDLLQRELKSRGLKGQAFAGSAGSLKAGSTGDILLGDKTMHAILMFKAGDAARKASSMLLRPFMMGKIYWPDHVGMLMMKNKANLAMLRELAERGVFTADENELVLNHVPWTSIVKNREIIFRGNSYNLLQLLRGNKDQFVIKDANGAQGKDVFVGKFITPQEWEDAIRLALETKSFIVQEFSDSLDFLAPDSSNGSGDWVPHKLIWGAFGYGERYGGVWVRLSTQKTSNGVINSATGAVEAIVYEARG